MRNNLILATAIAAAAASTGCRLTANNEVASGTFLVCQFDCSGSASEPVTRSRYLSDFGKLVAELQPGDTVWADAITEIPTATMRFPVQIVLPSYDPARNKPYSTNANYTRPSAHSSNKWKSWCERHRPQRRRQSWMRCT